MSLEINLAETLTSLATDYARLRYGLATADPLQSRRFHHSIKNFRPR